MRRKLFSKAPSVSRAAVAAVILFGVLGAWLLASHAATPTASIEAENGTVSSAASTVNDSSASSGQAVKFGNGSSAELTCPPLPAYPDSNCTGYKHTGVTLKKVPQDVTSGPGWHWDSTYGFVRIDSAGAVLDGLDISTSVYNYTFLGDMTVKDTLIRGDGITSGSACAQVGPNSTITDVEIGGGADGSTYVGCDAIYTGGTDPGSIVVNRINIHNTLHGIHPNGGTTVENSYIHDIIMGDPGYDTAHTDGSFIESGGNVTFDHDHFYSAGNNADFMVQDYSYDTIGVYNITVENSLFEAGPVRYPQYGQSNWGTAIENKDFQGRTGTVLVKDNVFSKGDWVLGPMCLPEGAQTSGNTYQDSTSAQGDIYYIGVDSPC